MELVHKVPDTVTVHAVDGTFILWDYFVTRGLKILTAHDNVFTQLYNSFARKNNIYMKYFLWATSVFAFRQFKMQRCDSHCCIHLLTAVRYTRYYLHVLQLAYFLGEFHKFLNLNNTKQSIQPFTACVVLAPLVLSAETQSRNFV